MLTGGPAESVVVGDFNGDGVPDLASANPGIIAPGSVSVFLGNGDGTFGARKDFPAEADAKAIAAGDFNRDGRLDLAVSNVTFGDDGLPMTVSIFLGVGDGTFLPKNDFPVDALAVEVIAGDFNQDGNPDLALACDGFVDVLLGNGDGTFRPKTAITVGANVRSVMSGDFNGDGRLDLAATSNPSGFKTNGRLDVLLGNGDGTFQSAAHFVCGVDTEGVAAGDLNGDGKLDLVAVNGGKVNMDTTQEFGTVSVLLGKGDGTFQQRPDFIIPFGSYWARVADLNGDGKADLVASNFRLGALIMPGNGDGTFRPPVTVHTDAEFDDVAVADLNHDGKPDLVAASSGHTLSVLLNVSGQLTIGGAVTDEGGAPLAGASLTLTGAGVADSVTPTGADGRYSFQNLRSGVSYTVTPSARVRTFTPQSQTFNNLSSNQTANFAATLMRGSISGKVTLVGSTPGGITVTLSGDASAVTTTAADGTYKFDNLPFTHNYTVTPSSPKFSFFPSGITFNNLLFDKTADFNGTPQTFTINGWVNDRSKFAFLPGLALTLSGSKAATTTTDSQGNYIFRDLPVGGDYTVTVSPRPSDTVFQNYLLSPPLSQHFPNFSTFGTAFFGATLLVNPVINNANAIVAGDFNGDGKTDLVVSPAVGTDVSLLLGNGDGTFQAEKRVTLASTSIVIVAGDFDGDGKSDLALPGLDSQQKPLVVVYFSNGDGTFEQKSFALPGPSFSRSTNAMLAADVNLDGKLDLVEAGATTSIDGVVFSMNALVNNGGRDFKLQPATTLQSSPQRARAADFNGDGKPDIVLANDPGTLSILSGNGDGTFSAPSDINLGAHLRRVAVGDLNNDGKADVVAYDDVTGTASALLGNGDATFKSPLTFNAPGTDLVAADFNGDGKLDLAVLNNHANQVDTFFGKGDGTFSAAASNPVNQTPFNLVVGDFNADGSPDLAVVDFRNQQGHAAILLDTITAPAVRFSASAYSVSEKDGAALITLTRSGDLSRPASVGYSTSDITASDRSDYTAAIGTLNFAPGESSKSFTVFVTDDAIAEGPETLALALGDPAGAALGGPSTATLTIANDDGASTTANPADDPQFFVRQHYRDFLGRDPDASGLQFWTQNIESCGADSQCRAVKRVNVSAAFFLSIEFQETGYLVYRLNQAAYNRGETLRLRQFLPDTREIGRGVVVGQGNWQQQLEDNKQALVAAFVARPEFAARYPDTLSPAQFVEALNANTGDPLNPNSGGALTQAERDQLVSQLTSSGNTAQGRAQVLRAVAENAEFQRRQFNKAFVLMEYFGYLRRNPDDLPDKDFSGYQFWLTKLNQFHGNFAQAEMVKAFISSAEYRQRFGQ